MLDTHLKQQLSSYLQALVSPIEIILTADDSEKAVELRALVRELSGLSEKISLAENGANPRIPSMEIAPAGISPRVAFAGIPLGHEFSSLVLALLHSGGHPPKTEAALIEQIEGLQGEFRFETYVSLSCQNCPDVVQALNLMATLNPNISHTMIDGALFQDEVDSRKVMAVPSVYLNGQPFGQGRMTLAEIVNKVDTGAAKRKGAKLAEKAPYDLLVVGGGPAGAAAAIYAARKGIRTGIVAERFGGQVLDTVGIENFISVKKTEGPKLVAGLEEHVRDYAVDIITEERAAKLRRERLVEIDLDSGATLKSRAVIIATGARWREMHVPGEQEYRGKGVAYCPHCDGPLFKGKSVAVIGGGNSGIEAAIDLAGIVKQVTVLEFADTLRADEVLIRKAKAMGNITIVTHAATTAVIGDGERVTGLTYTDRTSGETGAIAVAGIFVQIGLVPNTEWLKGDMELSRSGEIVIGAKGETSVPGVFAAGDVVNLPFKQIIIAMGSGATASLGAFDYLIREQVEDASGAIVKEEEAA